ncbi:MAG: MerR family transcriptional regulator [Eubacteriales bacterium]|nr:MerR family transcriptional regulator [Eubacteriales bacterium]
MWHSIKQVSAHTGLKPHVLRYYEKEGLLPDVARSPSGVRRYRQQDLDGLGLICCLKNTGMSIRQIREFVELSKHGDATLAQRCDMLRRHKQNVEEDIAQMQLHLEKVGAKIAYFTAQYEEYLQNGGDK